MLSSRIQNNIAKAPLSLTGSDAEAARWLFSFLAGIEEAAVLYAQKGFGVDGQLDDELSHRDTFKAIASHYGKVEPLDASTARLLSYLESQDGDIAKFLFGIVCETWVEGVFHRLAQWSPMFDVLEQEEARHAKASIRQFDADEAEPYLREVEALIREVANSPYFLVPMAHLFGIAETARLGLENAKRHKETCQLVGLEAGGDIRLLEEKCETAIRAEERGLPQELEQTAWQRSKMKIFKRDPFMRDSVIVPISGSHADAEAKVVQAVARIISREPALNTTIRGTRLYRPSEIVVGVRRLHHNSEVITVYVRDPHLSTVGEIKTEIASKTKKLRDRPYKEVPDYVGLEDLLPPARAAVTLTQTAGLGVQRGFSAAPDDEGSTIHLCLGDVDGKTHIGILHDHRAGDGREIGALCAGLSKAFKE